MKKNFIYEAKVLIFGEEGDNSLSYKATFIAEKNQIKTVRQYFYEKYKNIQPDISKYSVIQKWDINSQEVILELINKTFVELMTLN